jgi:hypothetical protein
VLFAPGGTTKLPNFGIQPTVFASKAEVRLFHTLRSRWAPKLQIFPQLPLANILGPPPPSATEAEREFHYKTSIDYTLCDQQHRPLLSVEFDGLGHGYSKDGEYVPMRPVPGRKRKLDYKLRIAREAGYPFFVVSYEDTTRIEAGESLTMLDAIIGRVLSRAASGPLAVKLVTEHQHQIDQLGHEADDYISDLVIDAGYMAKLEHDAFESAIAKMKYQLGQAGQPEHVEAEHFEKPPASEPTGSIFDGTLDPKDMRARFKALQEAHEHGTTAILRLKNAPTIVRKVTLRAVGDWFEASAISEQIARYLVLRHATKLLGLHETPAMPMQDR